MTLLQLSWYSY